MHRFTRLTPQNVYDYVGATIFYKTSHSTAYGMVSEILDEGRCIRMSNTSGKIISLEQRRVNILSYPIEIKREIIYEFEPGESVDEPGSP